MRHYLIVLLSAVVLVAGFLVLVPGVPSVHALPKRVAMPANCSSNCGPGSSQIRWSGTQQGVDVHIEFSSWTQSNCTGTCNMQRFVEMRNSSTGHYAQIGYGWSASSFGSGLYCDQAQGYYTFLQYDVGGGTAADCFFQPSGLTLGVNYEFGFYQVHGTTHYKSISVVPGQNGVDIGNFGADPDQMDLEEWEAGVTWTGSLFSTAVWPSSQWYSGGSQSFKYQTTNDSPMGANPPWMGWVSGHLPSQGGGGEAYSCGITGSTNPC